MQPEQYKRVQGAIEEEMTVEPVAPDEFVVKGKYTVRPNEPFCSCPDFEHRKIRCKHIVRTKLELWFGNVLPGEPDDTEEDSEYSPEPIDRPAIEFEPTDGDKPESLSVQPDFIPSGLQEYDQWVCWKHRYIADRDDWTKVPIDVEHGGFASSTDPDTWTDFVAAMVKYNNNENIDGIGICLSSSDDLFGIDIDDCRDPDTGDINIDVAEFVADLDCYVEISPSGTGLRAFVRGEKSCIGNQGDLHGAKQIEVYDTGRYLTVTGCRISEAETISMNQDAIDRVGVVVDSETSRLGDFS